MPCHCHAPVAMQKTLASHIRREDVPPTCDVCRGLLVFFFPPPFSRAYPFSRSAVSSAGKICHSRFVALPFMNTFEKARGGADAIKGRCQSSGLSLFAPMKRNLPCIHVGNTYLTMNYWGRSRWGWGVKGFLPTFLLPFSLFLE